MVDATGVDSADRDSPRSSHGDTGRADRRDHAQRIGQRNSTKYAAALRRRRGQTQVGSRALDDPPPFLRPEEEEAVFLDRPPDVVAPVVVPVLRTSRVRNLLPRGRINLVQGEKIPCIQLVVPEVLKHIAVKPIGP